MVNYKLKTILVMAERTKFILQGTKDLTIRLPIEYLHSMGWKIGDEVIIQSAYWDKNKLCHAIKLELAKKPKLKGSWAS